LEQRGDPGRDGISTAGNNVARLKMVDGALDEGRFVVINGSREDAA
jgi:hypothetical protein